MPFDGGGLFPTAGQMVTRILQLNKVNASGAKLTATENFVPGDAATYELSPNAGTNWETVTNGAMHWFTNTGSAVTARVTMTGIGGTATYISKLDVEVIWV